MKKNEDNAVTKYISCTCTIVIHYEKITNRISKSVLLKTHSSLIISGHSNHPPNQLLPRAMLDTFSRSQSQRPILFSCSSQRWLLGFASWAAFRKFAPWFAASRPTVSCSLDENRPPDLLDTPSSELGGRREWREGECGQPSWYFSSNNRCEVRDLVLWYKRLSLWNWRLCKQLHKLADFKRKEIISMIISCGYVGEFCAILRMYMLTNKLQKVFAVKKIFEDKSMTSVRQASVQHLNYLGKSFYIPTWFCSIGPKYRYCVTHQLQNLWQFSALRKQFHIHLLVHLHNVASN